MTVLTGPAKARFVHDLFARIATRYDLMNRLMSMGQDQRWRRLTVDLTRLQADGQALDVAAGTGDIAFELARSATQVTAVDFCVDMMVVGRHKLAHQNGAQRVRFVGGDALCLPFPDNSFDCATTGFAMRNVVDIEGAFREMRRVIRPGGWVVCLELTKPPSRLFRQLYGLYFYRIVPLIGRLITGDPIAYTYLPNSLTNFLNADQLKAAMEAADLRNVTYQRLNFGTIAIHAGQKV